MFRIVDEKHTTKDEICKFLEDSKVKLINCRPYKTYIIRCINYSQYIK
jgi:hypothetical protein